MLPTLSELLLLLIIFSYSFITPLKYSFLLSIKSLNICTNILSRYSSLKIGEEQAPTPSVLYFLQDHVGLFALLLPPALINTLPQSLQYNKQLYFEFSKDFSECVLQVIFFSSHEVHLLYSITLQIQLLELYHHAQLFVYLLELFSFYVFYNFQPQLI